MAAGVAAEAVAAAGVAAEAVVAAGVAPRSDDVKASTTRAAASRLPVPLPIATRVTAHLDSSAISLRRTSTYRPPAASPPAPSGSINVSVASTLPVSETTASLHPVRSPGSMAATT